jgi:hypothetical protein
MNTPIAFIVYKRPDTTRRVFETIRQARPPRLYLIADGPKTPDLESKCREVRQIVENGIDWDCELRPVYSDKNLGLARRVQTGLDEVFSREKAAIILEDDTLPNDSFFRFCEELLLRYANDNQVAHISGCNLHSESFADSNSYSLCSIVNIWGWATWARAWQSFDLRMESWNSAPQDEMLNQWCHTGKERKGTRSMFDLHCQNEDPWAWSYQWIYACWSQNGLSVVPHKNLVSNIGIGPDASNTKSDKRVAFFPERMESIEFPLVHPTIKRDKGFESRYRQKEGPTITRQFKNFLKMLTNKLRKPIKR